MSESKKAQEIFDVVMEMSLKDTLSLCYRSFEYPGMDKKRIDTLLFILESKLKAHRLNIELNLKELK